MEIVLNTGAVIDSQSFDLEWEGPNYGDHIKLVDLDGDGVLEVLGQSGDRILRVYDIDLRQIKVPF